MSPVFDLGLLPVALGVVFVVEDLRSLSAGDMVLPSQSDFRSASWDTGPGIEGDQNSA